EEFNQYDLDEWAEAHGEEQQISAAFFTGNNKGKFHRGNTKNNVPRTGITCYYCQGKGHIKRDCPRFKASSTGNHPHGAASSGSNSNSSGSGGAASCAKCGMRNHRTDQHDDNKLPRHLRGKQQQHVSGGSSVLTADFALSAMPWAEAAPIDMVEKNSNMSTSFFLDSACSANMTGNKSLFTGPLRKCEVKRIELANKNIIPINECGTVVLQVKDGKNKKVKITLPNVYYNPSIQHNLLSLGELDEQNWQFHSGSTAATLCSPSGITIPLKRFGRMYVLEQNYYRYSQIDQLNETGNVQCYSGFNT